MLVKKMWRKKSKTPKHQECNKLQIQERKFMYVAELLTPAPST